METFAKDTYWLFGSEACNICRAHEQSNRDVKADQIADEHFSIHMSTPQNKNYAIDLLDAYDGWRDYERIDKELYNMLKKELNRKLKGIYHE